MEVMDTVRKCPICDNTLKNGTNLNPDQIWSAGTLPENHLFPIQQGI